VQLVYCGLLVGVQWPLRPEVEAEVEETMKRVLFAVLTAALAIGLSASGADAQKKKKAPAKKPQAAPSSQKIAESMGDVHWGASKEELTKYFTEKLKEKYRPMLGKIKDSVEEDRLRQKARQELEAIQKGAVDFDGRATGWDVSFLKGEFTHGNDESMLVIRDANSQNFYFFIGGKLWKWYKAFDAAVFPAGNFDTFAASVQKRFGPAKEVEGELRPGEGQLRWLEWQDKQTRLRAVDETSFYGFYCLVFEEKSTVDSLAKLRRNTDQKGGDKRHAVVESVTAERNTAEPDDSPNIVDRITGRLHQDQRAPEPGADQPSASASGKTKAKAKSDSKPSRPVDNENDPISGLGL
jgi:hypothetical protein